MHKKFAAPFVAAVMAATLTAAPAHAQSSINLDFGLSSLSSLSSNRTAPAPTKPAPAPAPAPQKTRGQVAAEMKQQIIAANKRLGHTYSAEMEAHAQKYANHAVNQPLNYRTVADGIDVASFTGNLGTAKTKGVIVRVADRSVQAYLKSLYTVPELAGTRSFPFGVAVNPATGEYYVAIAALIG